MTKFGILITDGDAHTMIDRAVSAENAGFDSVFVGHHRFTPGFGYTIHPWILGAAMAARTERIQLGTSIFLLPLSHPLDVAEEVASLDLISRGRVVFGAGLGYRPYEFEAMGLPYNKRGRLMSECLEIVRGVWENESFSYDGEFYSFDNVTLTPRPAQQHIPIWVGANTPPAVERAARLGDGWIAGFSDRLPQLVPKLAGYRKMAADNGRSSTVCLMRLVGMGPTRDDVESNWIPKIYEMLRGYARVAAPTERGDQTETSFKAARRGDISLAEMGTDMLIAGTPEDVIAGLRRTIEETGCDHVVVSTGDLVSEDFLEVFGREVIPAFNPQR